MGFTILEKGSLLNKVLKKNYLPGVKEFSDKDHYVLFISKTNLVPPKVLNPAFHKQVFHFLGFKLEI